MRLWVAMPSLAGVLFLAVASPVSCIQSESLADLWLLSQSCRSWILHRSMLQRQVRKSCIFAMPHAPEPSPQKRWLLHCSINLSLSLSLSFSLSFSFHTFSQILIATATGALSNAHPASGKSFWGAHRFYTRRFPALNKPFLHICQNT